MARKKTKKRIMDKELLTWIREGRLRLEHPLLPKPQVFHRDRRLTVNPLGGRRANRYRFIVSDGCNPSPDFRQRTVLLHRFVWMACHDSLIDDRYDIHHIDGNRLNCSIHNLVILSREDHINTYGGSYSDEWD